MACWKSSPASFVGHPRTRPEKFWHLSLRLCTAPDEFVAMCGARGVGQVGGLADPYFAMAMTRLRSLASDPRWRVREAVAMSLQGLIVDRPERSRRPRDGSRTVDGSRCVPWPPGVAEPKLMKNAGSPGPRSPCTGGILARVAGSRTGRSEGSGPAEVPRLLDKRGHRGRSEEGLPVPQGAGRRSRSGPALDLQAEPEEEQTEGEVSRRRRYPEKVVARTAERTRSCRPR